MRHRVASSTVANPVPVILFLVPGAGAPPAAYVPFVETLVNTSAALDLRLHASVLSFPLDLPTPLELANAVRRERRRLIKRGVQSSARTCILGHSLGGVAAQTLLVGKKRFADALLLYGATVLRKLRRSLTVPTFTVAAELDGLMRVSRHALSHYHQAEGQSVVVALGLNHWSIADGPPPPRVSNLDLHAEVSSEEGHARLASNFARYLAAQFLEDRTSRAFVASAVEDAVIFFRPLLEALELEGNRHLRPSCDFDWPTAASFRHCPWRPYPNMVPRKARTVPAPPPDCLCGSPWVSTKAQPMLANLSTFDFELRTTDAFFRLDSLRPVHLPHIFEPAPGHSCSPSKGRCTIVSTTVTHRRYDPFEALDTGSRPIGALELKAELKSMQAIREAAGQNLSSTYGYAVSSCRAINEAAYVWALSKSGVVAQRRFRTRGRPLVMVDDMLKGSVLEWFQSRLEFVASTDSNAAVVVRAPYFYTANLELGLRLADGHHWCSLLSPARALEWIMIDGLRPNL